MASAPGASSASDPSKDDTLKAPFPRTNNTTRPSPSTRRPPTTASSSSTSKPILTARAQVVPNRQTTMPSSGSISGSMGPPPAGRRNERFDRLFYTSPLPRSISRAYNNLQAAGGVAPGTSTTTSVTPTTGVARTTATVPSALRMGVMTDGINVGGTKVAPHRAPGDVDGGVPVRGLLGKATEVEAVAVEEDPASIVSCGARASEVSSVDSHKSHAPSSNEASLGAAEDPASVSSPPEPPTQAWNEDDADMHDTTEDEEIDASGWRKSEDRTYEDSQKGGATIGASEIAAKKGSKRSDSSSPPPTPPRKLARTATSSSPGQVRSTRPSGKKQGVKLRTSLGATVDEQTNTISRLREKARRSSLDDTVERQKGRSGLSRLSSSLLRRDQSQPNAPAFERFSGQSSPPPPSVIAPKRERPTSTLPGFKVPPGILDETGSLWDPESGRRQSRRVSAGLPSPFRSGSAPTSTEKRVSKNHTPTNSFGGKTKERSAFGEGSSTSGESRGKKLTRKSFSDISNGGVERERRLSILRPNSSAGESQVRKSTRSSLGSVEKAEKEVRWVFSERSSSSEEETTTSTPGRFTRSSLVEKETDRAERRENQEHIKSLEKGKLILSKSQDDDTILAQDQQSPSPPLIPPSLPPKTRRSIRNSIDLTSLPSTDTSAAAVGGQDQTPHQASTKKAPQGVSWVVEETPQASTTAATTAERTGLARSWVVGETPQLEKTRTIHETAQPEKTKRVTRTSIGQKAKNQEFEFSDDEK